VTHELRAPVAGAQSLLRSVMHETSGSLNEIQREVLRRTGDRLDALQLLINDLLDLAAGKVDGLESRLEPVSVAAIVELVVERLASQASEQKVDVTVSGDRRELTVMGTDEGFGRIFVNLVGNAIKYTPAGGHVEVTLTEHDGEAAVSVADTGMGIPPADLPHLFEEFHRGANAKEAGIPGTGLGLAIVKDLVERYGGRLAVHSTLGEGTTFTVALPLATSPGAG
jgi:signal transduction histidine kinase